MAKQTRKSSRSRARRSSSSSARAEKTRRSASKRAARRTALTAAQWRALQRKWLRGYCPYHTAAKHHRFDRSRANDAIAFFEGGLRFIEGARAGDSFSLEDWQRAVVGAIWGWRDDRSETRRYREAMIYVPRKNGKTPLAAGLVLLALFLDREPGAQIYSAAADRDQASLIYRHAWGMAAREPALASQLKHYRTTKAIEYPAMGAIYKALSADAHTKHGLGVHMAVVDELHAHPSGDLVDVLRTGMAARRQPLMVHLTTADFVRESVCNTYYDYSCQVRDGAVDDPAFLPVIYEATVDDDWTDPRIWRRANPNLGVSVSEDYLKRESERALAEPSYENTFKRLHLNVRTQQDVRWLSARDWDNCPGAATAEALRGRACMAALDLSTRIDMTAWCLLFPPAVEGGVYAALWRFWLPEQNLRARQAPQIIDRLEQWVREGWIELTPGNVIDYELVQRRIVEDANSYAIEQCGFDPWNAQETANTLAAQGLPMIEMRQGYGTLGEPSAELERVVRGGLLDHGNNPVARWQASVVAAAGDPAGNVKPDKAASVDRIDGVVTLVMALGLWLRRDQQAGSIYDDGEAPLILLDD